MHLRPVRLGLEAIALPAAIAGVEHGFQHAVTQRLGQRPCQAYRRQAIERKRHRAAGDAQRACDRPVTGAALVLEAHDLPYPSHRHSLGWHRLPRPSLVCDEQRAAHRPAVERSPPERWPTSDRNGRHHVGKGGRVGTEITPRPPHRSGRAAFPHPALPEACPRGGRLRRTHGPSDRRQR
jgi:hypothetical protein